MRTMASIHRPNGLMPRLLLNDSPQGELRLNWRELLFGEAKQLHSFELSGAFSRHWWLS
jgi:hypothetical protein